MHNRVMDPFLLVSKLLQGLFTYDVLQHTRMFFPKYIKLNNKVKKGYYFHRCAPTI